MSGAAQGRQLPAEPLKCVTRFWFYVDNIFATFSFFSYRIILIKCVDFGQYFIPRRIWLWVWDGGWDTLNLREEEKNH